MSVVNIGTYPDDPSADDANVAFSKINAAFEDLGDGTISVNTAEKLKNKRTIKISGDAEGEALFDGSGNTEIKVSTKGTGLTDLATWRTAYRTSLGQAASGNFINTFSTSFAETAYVLTGSANLAWGYDSKHGYLSVSKDAASPTAYLGGGDSNKLNWVREIAFIDSTVAASNKLATARDITLSGGAAGTASFDGSKNINLNVTDLDGSKISSGTIAAARVATLNQNTTGNAATATKLATSVKIHRVTFDGSADITIPNASVTETGVIQLASDVEAQGLTNSIKVLTPASYKLAAKAMFNANGDAPMYAARAWLSFGNIQVSGTYTQTLTTITVTATAHNLAVGNLVYLTVSSGLATSGWYTVTTVTSANIFTVESTVSQTTSGNIIKNLAIYGSGNIASITDDGVGLFTISFITPMPSVNYVPVGSAVGTNAQQPVFKVIGTAATVAPTTKTVSAIQLGMAYGGTATDSNNMYLAFIGG